RVSFAPLPDEVVARRLVEAHGIEPAAAQVAAGLAGGSLGRAIDLASSEELPLRRERVTRLLQAARGRSAQALLDAAGELSGDRRRRRWRGRGGGNENRPPQAGEPQARGPSQPREQPREQVGARPSGPPSRERRPEGGKPSGRRGRGGDRGRGDGPRASGGPP